MAGGRSVLGRMLLVQALAWTIASAGLAEEAPWYDPELIADFRVGIYCDPKVSETSSADDTIKGSVERLSGNPTFARGTTVVPAIDGINFGVEGRESPPSPETVTITVIHPPLGRNRVRKESWETQMQGNKVTYHGYFLGLSDGDPTGDWVITGTRSGKVLFKARFKVVKPSKKHFDPCRVGQTS